MVTLRIACTSCDNVILYERKGTRGRLPTKCDTCKEAAKRERVAKAEPTPEERKAQERVDNLEMMLKSRGTHIAQHQEDDPKMRVPIGYYLQGRASAESDDWITHKPTGLIRYGWHYTSLINCQKRNDELGWKKFRLKPIYAGDPDASS